MNAVSPIAASKNASGIGFVLCVPKRNVNVIVMNVDVLL